MYEPNAPPKGGYPPAPGAQPPPYSEQGVSYPPPALGHPGYGGYPPPIVGQPEIGFAGGAYPAYPQPSAQAYPQPYPYPQPYQPQPNQPYGGPAPGQPIVVQPTAQSTGAGEWMPLQPAFQQNSNCPPGLEYLTAIDQLLVHQKVELLEAFTGFETTNKYTVKNSMGQKVFRATEISDCCTRQLCGPNRAFDMKIVDNNDHEVIHLNRPLACSSCFFPCCLQTMEVTAPPGTVIGSIQQEWSIIKPKFSIKDASGETVLTIEGPFCTFSMCGDVEFNVYSRGGDKVGKISKQWSGLVREAFTDADMFGINFPLDLDVRIKAVMLGACFLIDFMFFEKSGDKETDRPGML
ncbi:phospholipid scramblase 2-like [Daphnia pulex]|uniref:phospholipid scramblase 2-like n=1 Tax=Daphnia pulex TaxID=6669 RepID=UPI001EE0E433|nr:phospholipid scramblase 2-like [Daphnia pulex]